LRALRANRGFCTDKKLSAQNPRLRVKTEKRLGVAFIQDRRSCADGFIIRARSVIGADGPPAAQVLTQWFEREADDCVGWFERGRRVIAV